MDDQTLYIENFLQYRSYIEEANKTEDKEPELKVSYDFKSLYGAKDIYDYETIAKTIHQIDKDNEVYKKISKTFFAEGSLYDKNLHKKHMPLYLRCRFESDTFFGFLDCTKYRTCKHK